MVTSSVIKTGPTRQLATGLLRKLSVITDACITKHAFLFKNIKTFYEIETCRLHREHIESKSEIFTHISNSNNIQKQKFSLIWKISKRK